MSISEFVQIFLSICGGVSIVGGAAAVIFKWITPAFRLNKRVETLEEHDRRDYESLRRIAERDSLILEVLSTMLDSQISGNNVEELKKTKLLFWKTDPVPDKCSFPESNIISFRRVRIIILDNLSEKNYSRGNFKSF